MKEAITDKMRIVISMVNKWWYFCTFELPLLTSGINNSVHSMIEMIEHFFSFKIINFIPLTLMTVCN